MITRSTTVAWLVLVALGALAGWELGRMPLQVDLAELRTAHAETARLAARSAANTLQQAQQRGNALTDELAQRQVQIDQISREKRDAINRLTTGRACLSSAAVRLLNQPEDFGDYGHQPVLPAPPGSADAAGGAFASDVDVGQWAITARAQYDTCRQRLNALIDWHAATTPHPSAANAHDD